MAPVEQRQLHDFLFHGTPGNVTVLTNTKAGIAIIYKKDNDILVIVLLS